jgi:meso-butanediol dehydrogenase/(S,S)-butanediol dehydrogenase/diacetyl reductase
MDAFEGKGVLVTGAAGDIGAEIARSFLDRGARVHVTDVEADRLAARAAALAGREALTVSLADLAEPADVARLAAEATERCGRIDVLVNNAAVQAQGDLEACTQQLFDQAYAINVRAPYLLAKALVPAMMAAGGGAIINIASVHATAPGPKRLAYATTKTALLGMTRSLAVDLGRHNIRVNAVSPGATLTDQLRSSWARHNVGGIDTMAHAVRQHPLGRIAQVSDVAEAVLYLAATRFVHGIELRVDGGFLAGLRLLPQDGS